jgi:cytoskeleton protein RodZ
MAMSAIKGSIFQGETKSYSGQSSISIYLSNPAGIDVTHNGKLLSPLGGQNQEVRRTFR